MDYSEEYLGLESVVLNCNKKALDFGKRDDYQEALHLLHRAIFLLEQSATSFYSLRSMTLNNLGCLYKKIGEYSKALVYLKDALQYEKEGGLSTVGTHLNICAILSLKSEHEKALTHAMWALKTLKNKREITANAATCLVIAYHNAATELEYLGQIDESNKMFYEGWEYAVEYLGRTHQLTNTMLQSYSEKPSYKKSASQNKQFGYRRNDSKLPMFRNKTPIIFDKKITVVGDDYGSTRYRKFFAFFSKRRREAAQKIQKMFRFNRRAKGSHEIVSIQKCLRGWRDRKKYHKLRRNTEIVKSFLRTSLNVRKIQEVRRSYQQEHHSEPKKEQENLNNIGNSSLHNELDKQFAIQNKNNFLSSQVNKDYTNKKDIGIDSIYSEFNRDMSQKDIGISVSPNDFDKQDIGISTIETELENKNRNPMAKNSNEKCLSTIVEDCISSKEGGNRDLDIKNEISKSKEEDNSISNDGEHISSQKEMLNEMPNSEDRIQSDLTKNGENSEKESSNLENIETNVQKDKTSNIQSKGNDFIVIIQKTFRAKLSKNYLNNYKNKAKNLGLIIVSYFKQTNCSKLVSNHRLCRTIQSKFRSFEEKSKIEIQRQKIIQLQSQIRSFLSQKQIKNDSKPRKNKTNHSFHGRKASLLYDFAKNSSLLKVQTVFRRFLGQIAKQELHYKLHSAAIVIQKFYKGFKSNSQFKHLKTFLKDVERHELSTFKLDPIHIENSKKSRSIIQLITLIQARVRGYLARKHHKNIKKYILIQKNIRIFLFKRRIETSRQIKILQRVFRKFLAKNVLTNQHLKERRASLLIQATFRTFLYRHFKTSINIQRTLRAFFAKKTIEEYGLNERLKQKLLDDIRQKAELKDKSARIIQAHFKGYIIWLKYNNIRDAVNVIRKNFKMIKVRRMYLSIIHAIIYIQRWYRHRKLALKPSFSQHDTTIFISTKFRMH